MNPNIVCVSIDSLRADFCSFINAEETTTPFISSLSDEAKVFNAAITPSVWTLPVHASIFTGLFPPEHGIQTGQDILGDHPTFAEQLQAEGYTTQAFYDNGWLETGDILRGFSKRTTTKNTKPDKSIKSLIGEKIKALSPRLQQVMKSAYKAQRLYRNWRGFESLDAPKDTDGQVKINEAISKIDEAEQPFCWFLHFDEAHWKYEPPNPYHREFTNRSIPELVYNNAVWQDRVYGSRTGRLKTITGEISPPKREVETFKNLYRGGIKYCDWLIKQLVDGFKEAGVWDETVLILFGDHGDSFGEKGVFGHHFSTDDSLIRVPLIIRDPTNRLSSENASEPASLVDLYPTVLGLSGAETPNNSGIDLAVHSRDYAYTYYDVSNHDYYIRSSDRGISTDDLPPAIQHVIWQSECKKGTWYPIEEDWEVVGGDEDGLLRKQLSTHTDQLRSIGVETGEISNSVKQQLKDMGYLRK